MCPVQVVHICDICGVKGLRQDMQMGRLVVAYDGNPVLEVQLACAGCKEAARAAVDTAVRERKAK